MISRTDVWHIQHAIHNGIAEVHIVARHVNLGTKHHLTGFYVTAVHFFKKTKRFFHWTIAIGAFCTRTSGSSLLSCNLFAALFVDISATLFDERNGKVPKVLEIVGSVVDVVPLVA